MSVSVVAIPRFEPANLSRAESGEERLALNKNHEGAGSSSSRNDRYGMNGRFWRKAAVRRNVCS
jgi:hypothetical protein